MDLLLPSSLPGNFVVSATKIITHRRSRVEGMKNKKIFGKRAAKWVARLCSVRKADDSRYRLFHTGIIYTYVCTIYKILSSIGIVHIHTYMNEFSTRLFQTRFHSTIFISNEKLGIIGVQVK